MVCNQDVLARKRGLGDLPAFTVLRTTIGWIVANLACEAFALYKPGNYFRVRYEDLVHTPGQVIGDVLQQVSLQLPSSIEPSEAAANRHQLYGNAMRFKPLTLSGLKEDVSWKTAMPKGYRWFVSAFCWPFLRKYDLPAGQRDELGQPGDPSRVVPCNARALTSLTQIWTLSLSYLSANQATNRTAANAICANSMPVSASWSRKMPPSS